MQRWRTVETATGERYYFNEATGETSWDVPGADEGAPMTQGDGVRVQLVVRAPGPARIKPRPTPPPIAHRSNLCNTRFLPNRRPAVGLLFANALPPHQITALPRPSPKAEGGPTKPMKAASSFRWTPSNPLAGAQAKTNGRRGMEPLEVSGQRAGGVPALGLSPKSSGSRCPRPSWRPGGF